MPIEELCRESTAAEIAGAIEKAVPLKKTYPNGDYWTCDAAEFGGTLRVLVSLMNSDGKPDYWFSVASEKESRYKSISITIVMRACCIEDRDYPTQEIREYPDDPNINGIWETYKIFVEHLNEYLAKSA